MEVLTAMPQRGVTVVASHTAAPEGLRNGWYRDGKENACRRYATSPLHCRVPKGTLAIATDIPAISPYLRHGCMAGYPYLMPTASASPSMWKLN